MKKNINFIWSLLKQYKRMQILGLALTIFYSVLYFVCPMFSQFLIDNIIDKFQFKQALLYIAIFAIILLIQPVIQYIQKNIFVKMSENISADLRNKVFEKTMLNSLTFFENQTKGELLSRHIDDTQKVSNFVSDIFITIIKNFLIVISIMIGMFYYSVLITSIILLILFLTLFVINKFNSKIQQLSREVKEKYDDNCSIINDTYFNIFIIKVYELYGFCKIRFTRSITDYRDKNIKYKKTANKFNVCSEILTVGCIVTIYVIGFLKVLQKDMSLGEVMALVLYFQMLLTPLMELLNSNISFQTIIPYVDRILEYISVEERICVVFSDDEVLKSDIEVKNVSFKYNDNYILENINLCIKEKSLIAVVGKSGNGKTTIMKILLGLVQPNCGTVFLGGRPIQDVNLSKYILMVPQHIKLFNMSILDNIRCGDKNIRIEEIYKACKDIGVYDDIIKLKEGFQTIITEEINISGGQAQRICIARALVRKPSVLIFDEPTSSLDFENIKAIVDVLKLLRSHCTVIVVTHDKFVMKEVDSVYEIVDKKIKVVG